MSNRVSRSGKEKISERKYSDFYNVNATIFNAICLSKSNFDGSIVDFYKVLIDTTLEVDIT